MEIEVGEYGRTNLGKIIKFAWIGYSEGKKDESKVLLINNDILSNDFYYFKIGEKIVNHSKNIMDLIEKGDYVNGRLVLQVDYKNKNVCLLILFADTKANTNIMWYGYEQIKTILTKEQYEANCYKVGGENE